MKDLKKEDFLKLIYELKAFEEIGFLDDEYWKRVPGGWIYSVESEMVFIPYNDEFNPKAWVTPQPKRNG